MSVVFIANTYRGWRNAVEQWDAPASACWAIATRLSHIRPIISLRSSFPRTSRNFWISFSSKRPICSRMALNRLSVLNNVLSTTFAPIAMTKSEMQKYM